MPAVMPPSPITATTRRRSCFNLAAAAMPAAPDSEVPAWPLPKASYSLSSRLVNGARPFFLRIVSSPARRPVSILCG